MNMMFSPGTVLKNAAAGLPFYFSLIISGSAFGLFFLQTGLDLYRTGQKSLMFITLMALLGFAFGMLVVPLISTFIWLIAKGFGSDKTIKWAISAFSLSYSGALIYSICGILISAFLGWRTAIAFGVSGVLWATGPMIAAIREMIGGKVFTCVLLATVAGSIVLYCWSFIARI
jgi:hypothetical protein